MVHVHQELIPLKMPKIRVTLSRIWYMCSGFDTPKDEKQGNIEANMEHVYTPPPTATLIIFYHQLFWRIYASCFSIDESS